MIRIGLCRTVALLVCLASIEAPAVELKSVSLAPAGRDVRVLLDLSGPAKALVRQDSVHRCVDIRFPQTSLTANIKQPSAEHPSIAGIAAVPDKSGVRLRIKLKKIMEVESGQASQGNRWIVRMIERQPSKRAVETPTPVKASQPRPAGTGRTASNVHGPSRQHVIAIDAGHGGKDTGAIGPRGTAEKDVVLGIARKLAGMIAAEPGMRPVLIRKSDEFIDLRQRADLTRRARADLFLSLHADADDNTAARGSSVFTLSAHGASSVAARWLADRENSADLAGVKLRDKSKALASVLLDLSQTATAADSDRAAAAILRALQKNHNIHNGAVQRAGFVVLKSPDVPSVLVETAFISNAAEEQSLRSDKYQERIARSLFWGIRSYFSGQYSSPPRRSAARAATNRPEIVAQE